MKTFRKILVIMLCALTIGVFYGCKELGTVSFTGISFNTQSVEMNVGQEINLFDILKIENAEPQSVEFSSSNNLIAIVSPEGKLIARNHGKAIIEAKVDLSSCYLNVTVNKLNQRFSAPTALKFDYENGLLSWNNAFMVENGQTVYADEYVLYITKNSQETIVTTSDSFFEFDEVGSYKVQIEAKANNYLNSNLSSQIEFNVLPQVVSVSFDDTNKKLTWADLGDFTYCLEIENEKFETTNNYFEIGFEDEKEYVVSIYIKDQNERSKQTTTTFKRLAVPKLSVKEGKVEVEKIADAKKYTLSIMSAFTQSKDIELTDTNVYTFENMQAGKYYVSVQAVGSENVLSSKKSQMLEVEKLPIPKFEFDKQTRKFTTDQDGVEIFIKDLTTNKTQNEFFQNKQYEIQLTEGIYELYAHSLAIQNNQITSERTSSVYIKILGAITNLNHVLANNHSNLSFTAGIGFKDFEVYVDDVLVDADKVSLQEGKIVFADSADVMFSQAKDYKIKVLAKDYSFSANGSNYFVFDELASSNEIVVTRLDSPILVNEEDFVSWQNIEKNCGYEYILEKDGLKIKDGKIFVNQISKSDLRFGNYTLKVSSVGDGNLVLDSLSKSELSFSVKESLDAPTLTFDKTNHTLTIGEVENAEEYVVFYEDEIIVKLNNQNRTHDVSSITSLGGEHNFSVIAVSLSNSAEQDGEGNLFNSAKTSIKVTKYDSPTDIIVNANQTIVVKNIPQNVGSEQYEIFVNGQKVKKDYVLSEDINFEINVKFVSKPDTQTEYYIDSEESLFNVSRIEKVSNIQFNDFVLTWDKNEKAQSYQVYIKNDYVEFDQNFTENKFDTNLSSTLKAQIMEYGHGTQIYIVAVIGQIEVEKDGQGFISSNKSDVFVLKKLSLPQITEIIPQESKDQNFVTIKWQEVIDASLYVTAFDQVESEQTQTSFETINIDYNEHTFALYATANGFIPSNTVVLKIQRRPLIDSISVDENEKIIVSSDSKTTLVEVDDSIDVLSYTMPTDTTQTKITLRRIGAGLISNTLYLNSGKTEFSFRRLEQPEKPIIQNNQITWNEVVDADYYELKISKGEQELVLNLSQNYFDLADTRLLNFAESDILSYSVSVKAVVAPYSLNHGQIGLLSSHHSETKILEKLAVVQNVRVSALPEYEQTDVKIEFDQVANAEYYQVFVNDKLLVKTEEISFVTDKLVYDGEFSNNGKFEIKVVAYKQNALSSDASEAVVVNRLAKINQSSIKVTNKAQLSFPVVLNSQGYVVYYQTSQETSPKEFITTQNHDYSELVEKIYQGPINFFILAKADGSRYLSSEYTFVTVSKLEKPTISVFGDYLEIENPESAQHKLKVSYVIGEQTLVLDEKTLSNGQLYVFPNTWKHNGEPIQEGGKFVFEAYATKSGFIDSNISKVENVKLSKLAIDGFFRDSEQSDKLYLQIDAGVLAQRDDIVYTLKVGSFVDNQHLPNESGKIVYEITDELNNEISSKGTYTFSVYASSQTEIDSTSTSITVKRLAPVTSIYSTKGVLTWNKTTDSDVSKYLLKVSFNETEENLLYKSLDENYDNLFGISGQIVANVKSIGNISTTLTKDNVVLDSTYVVSNNAISNFTAHKLEAVSEISVIKGEFVLLGVDRASDYELVCLENDYVYELSENDGSYRSESMYEGSTKLTVDTAYSFKVRATSTERNILCSDLGAEIKVKLLSNPNTNQTINVSWTKASTNNFKIEYNQSQNSNMTELVVSHPEVVLTITTDQNFFDLDCNNYKLPAGEYEVKTRVIGSSSKDSTGCYYLTSAYCQSKSFSKLEAPQVFVENGILKWNDIEGANGYYVYYYKLTADEEFVYDDFVGSYTEMSTPVTQTFITIPDNFGDYNKNNIYFFGVRACYCVEKTEIAPSMVGVVFDEKDNQANFENKKLRKINKIKSPDPISLTDGTLVWSGLDYSYNLLSQKLLGENSPFVYGNDFEALANTMLELCFVDSNDNVRFYEINAVKMFEADITKNPLFSVMAPSFGIPANFKFGWPNLDFLAGDIKSLTPGMHNLSIKQIGNDYDYLTSMYNSSMEIYVPHAPVIKITDYVLSWNDIALSGSKAYQGEYKYAIVSENEVGKREIVFKTNDTSVDLRELVYEDKLVSGKHKLFVIVLGDNYYTNGFASNSLDIVVLPNVSTSINNGILIWQSISQTTAYNLQCFANDSNYDYERLFTDISWDFKELNESDILGNKLEYTLKIQAIGNGKDIISGKICELGKVTKLSTPNVSIQKGVFVWENIENNNGYAVQINQPQISEELKLEKDKTFYESSYQGFNSYNFRTLGSTLASLSESSVSFAISNSLSSNINAVILESVVGATTKDGLLSWQHAKDFSNAPVFGYKLSFDKSNFYQDVYYENLSLSNIDGVTYVVKGLDPTYLAGDYKIYIQAYASTGKIYNYNGVDYNLLLSQIGDNSVISFHKLDSVSSIKIQDGVISWTSNDDQSNTYKLTFKKGVSVFDFTVTGSNFDSGKLAGDDLETYKKMTVDGNYTLDIMVLAERENVLNSDIVTDLGFMKLSTISDVEYLSGKQEGFVIRWKLFDFTTEVNEYEYIITYTVDDGEIRTLDTRTFAANKGYSAEENCYYGEIDGSALLKAFNNAKKLSYSVVVVPITQSKWLSSSPSDFRSVSVPKALDGAFVYDENAKSISWTYESAESDLSFKIVDEIIELNEDNEITVLKTNIYTSKEKSFQTKEIGLHRISICVILDGGNISSTFVYFNYDVAANGIVNNSNFVLDENVPFSLINNNLFESGDGSENSPFEIVNEEQFANIVYRLNKPTYFGGEKVYSFVQKENLSLSSGINGEFAGIYDADNKSISLSVINDNQTEIALFNKVSQNAVVRNAKVSFTFKQNDIASITSLKLSAISVYNYGLIENSVVEAFEFKSSLDKSISIYYGSVTCNNFGKISNCVNNATISINGVTGQVGVRISNVYVGAIACDNKGQIEKSGNYGLIDICSRAMIVGGIVATNDTNAIIDQCFNKANIQTTVCQTGSTKNNVGGLVGHNKGTIKNSYVNQISISADLQSQSRTMYVGGLVGYASGEKGILINNCYANVDSITISNGEYATTYVGIVLGLSEAEDTTAQITSYYKATSSLVSVNKPPANFKLQEYENADNLLTLLNLADYVYAYNEGQVVLQWEIEE